MKVSRIVYTAFAWLFVAGVLLQVFFVGMTVVARQWPWTNHVSLGHTLALPLVVMLISMYVGKLPRRMKLMTWLLFGVYILQADVLIFLRDTVPVLSALHPVLALVDFAMGLLLATQATKLMQAGTEPILQLSQSDAAVGD